MKMKIPFFFGQRNIGIDGVASQSKQSQSVVFKNFVVSQDKQQITKVRDYSYNSAVPIPTPTNCSKSLVVYFFFSCRK